MRTRGGAVVRTLGAALTAALAIGAFVPSRAGAGTTDPCNGFGYTLCERVDVTAWGSWNGTITSSPAGISCRFVNGAVDPSSTCTHTFRSYTATSLPLEIDGTPDANGGADCGGDSHDNGPCYDLTTLSGVGAATFGSQVYFHVGKWDIYATVTPAMAGLISANMDGWSCNGTANCIHWFPYGRS